MGTIREWVLQTPVLNHAKKRNEKRQFLHPSSKTLAHFCCILTLHVPHPNNLRPSVENAVSSILGLCQYGYMVQMLQDPALALRPTHSIHHIEKNALEHSVHCYTR
jgi:hypothetical protein